MSEDRGGRYAPLLRKDWLKRGRDTLDAFREADPEGWSREEVRAAQLRARVLKQSRELLERRIAKIDAELADLERRAAAAGRQYRNRSVRRIKQALPMR